MWLGEIKAVGKGHINGGAFRHSCMAMGTIKGVGELPLNEPVKGTASPTRK